MEETPWLETLHEQIRERRDPWVVLEGRHAVDAAIGGWWEVPGVLVSEDSDWQAPVWSGLELVRTSRAAIEEMAGDPFHRGVLGLAKIPQETGEVQKFLAGLDADAVVVVCPRPADAANAGVVVRSAAALGAAAILCGAEGASPFDRKAVRASAGAVFKLPVRVGDGGLLLRSLKAAKFELLAAAAGPESTDIRSLPKAEGRRALLIGPEEPGLGAFWTAASDRQVCIPTADGVESIDAAAACAIMLWELMRGRDEEAD